MPVTGGRRSARGGELADQVQILLVDDDETWARVTARLLASNNDAFDVSTAHSLAAGRQAFAERDPDCIVCDYQLGDGTGLALLDTVRETDPDRPFVLVTGRGDEAVASEAIGRGVTDYIRKDQDDDEADLLASRIANGVRSYRTRRALERERRSKAALLDVLTGTAGKTDLSQQFCRQLVEERGYACAWLGREQQSAPVPQGAAGREAYLEDVLTPGEQLPPDEPARRALDLGETVRVYLDESPEAETTEETWAAAAASHGFAGAIAAPIRHDGMQFGVMVAYADDRVLLTDRERDAMREFAETVGYALTNAERKHSLMSSLPVMLRVELSTEAVPLGSLREALPSDAGLDLLSTVPRDESTLYVTEIHGASAATLETVATVDGVESLQKSADPARCEFVAPDPTPETLLASHGVRVQETTVNGETVALSLQVPDEAHVATVRDVLDREFEDADVSAIWTGRAQASSTTERDALDALTDRQRDVIRHAYEVGYFERPRDTSATELADQFDIARATLTQHLRTAERKLLGRLFSDGDTV